MSYQLLWLSFYLINYAFKVAKLNITKQYLRTSVGKEHNPYLSIDRVRIKLYKFRGALHHV